MGSRLYGAIIIKFIFYGVFIETIERKKLSKSDQMDFFSLLDAKLIQKEGGGLKKSLPEEKLFIYKTTQSITLKFFSVVLTENIKKIIHRSDNIFKIKIKYMKI